MIIKATKLGYQKLALLAFAGIAFLTPVVQAATITPNMGDVILGFQATGSPGQTLNVEVDLGPVSQFYGLTPGTNIALSALSVADLSDNYGTNWYTRTDLSWGAVATAGRAAAYSNGVVNVPVKTIWGTAPNGAAAWKRGSANAQQSASAIIEPLFNTGSPLKGATSTTNSAFATVINNSSAGSWTYQDFKSPSTSFSFFNPTIDSLATIPLGGQVVAQFYELQPSVVSQIPGALLGNFVLTKNGLFFQTVSKIVGVSGNLAFGNVITGATVTATLTITNSGNSTLTVTNLTYPDAVFSGDFNGTIAAGSATNVTVSFAPVAVSNYNDTITINCDSTSGTNTIAASGTGTVPIPVIGLSGNLAFGNVITGVTSTATLTITNSGTATMTVTNITYPTGFSGDFNGTIAVGSATNVTVSFAPVAITNYSGTVTINCDAASGTNTISASGAGIPVPTQIIGLSGSLAFGSIITGTTATATLTISNLGNVTMTVSNISYPTGFSGAFSGPITAGNGTNVTVTFAPVSVTSYSGTVTVNSDATGGLNTISASGAGLPVPTRIVGLSGNLAFGSVITGVTSTATLTISNTGNATMTVSNISYPNAVFTGAFSGTIAAGSATNITVTFAPVAVTNYSGTVTVTSDKTSGTPTISISGAGLPVPTRIVGLSGGLSFGSVVTGTTSTASLTISNTGNSTMTVSNIAYPTGFSGSFSGTITAGHATNITVTFAPVAVTNYSGTVTVNSDATSGTNTIAADGNGTLVPTRIIGLSGSLAFGSIITGTTSTASLTLSNTGNSALTVSNISYPSGFSGAFSGAIAAGSATNITVTFAPVAVTNYSGTVTVNSDKTSGTVTIAASGAGLPVPTRVVVLSGSLAFGNVETGLTKTATLTIANRGNTNLTVSSISYPNAVFTGDFSGVILPSASTNITVTFAPVAVTNYSGTVTVNSDATGGTNTIAASGNGTSLPTAATPTFSPGSGTYSNRVTVTLSCTNSGAKIYFTTDSSTPTTNSALYVSGIVLSNTTTIQAIAAKTGLNNSLVGAATFTIWHPLPLTISTDSDLPVALKGVAYSQQLAAFNGTPPYTWSATRLPSGLSVNSSGKLSGTPSVLGTTEFLVTVRDAAAIRQTTNQWFSLTVTNPVVTFAPVVGTYTGLILQTNPTPTRVGAPTSESSGFIQIVVANKGSFAGNVTLNGVKTSYRGQFDLSGNATNIVGLTLVSLNLGLGVDRGSILGTVDGSGFRSTVLAELPDTSKTWTGKYTLVLSPADVTVTNLPQGYGYATLTVNSSGNGSLSGVLADGTPLNIQAPVSQSGTWPLYASLYGKTGGCISWVTLTSRAPGREFIRGAATGVVDWFAPASKGYAAFNTTLSLDGSLYTTGPRLNNTWALTFSGGGLVSNVVQTVTLDTLGKVVGANPVGWKVTVSSGLFTGNFTPVVGGRAIPFKGLLLQAEDTGDGFFQTTSNLSGGVTVELVP